MTNQPINLVLSQHLSRSPPFNFIRPPAASSTMPNQQSTCALVQRKTIKLNGTVSRLEAQLDHPSALAIAYARQWLKEGPGAMGLDVLASGVVRRAVEVYMHHLGRPDTDPIQEGRAVRSCCSRLTTDADDQKAAWERLQASDEAIPLPPWPDVLNGPDRAAQVAAFDDRAEDLFQQLVREKTQRLR